MAIGHHQFPRLFCLSRLSALAFAASKGILHFYEAPSNRSSTEHEQGLEDSALYNADLAPVPRRAPDVDRLELRRAVDHHVGVHPDLHARLVAHRRRHELVAGRPDDFPRQPHRAAADGAQRPRGHEVRHPVSRVLPRGVRHARRERPRACCARWWRAAGSASRRGSAATPSSKSSASFFPRSPTPRCCRCSGFRCRSSRASCSSGASTCGSSTGASIPSASCSPSRRRCSSSSGCCCSAGRTTRRADSGRCSRSRRRSIRVSRRRAGSGNSSSRR